MQGLERGTHRRRFAALIAVAVSAAVIPPAAAGASAASGGDAPPDPHGAGRVAAVVRALAARPAADLRRAGAPSASAVGGVGTIAEVDPPDDAPDAADITAMSATMQPGRIRFSATLPTTPDPGTDESWQVGLSFVAALIDVNGDATPDYDAFMVAVGSRWLGGAITDDGQHFLCNVNAGYSRATDVFSITVPLRCIGNPASVDFVMSSQYDVDPFDDSVDDAVNDFAPDATSLTLTGATTAPTLGGGFVLEGGGRVRGFTAGTGAPAALVEDLFSFDIARGIAATPDGGHAYVVDGYGGVHAVGFGANRSAARAFSATYWPGWDIARGVGVIASGRNGFVVDAYGGMHGFGIGERRAAPLVIGGPYWPAWDIVRGVAFLPNGTGGYVLDGFGGLHWFSLKVARSAPAVVGNAYWPGQDRARGVTIFPNGTGGYVIDSAGGIHPFGIGGATSVNTPSAGPIAARGITVLPRLLKLPRPAPAPA